MLSAKQLLLKQTAAAYADSPDMSLKSALAHVSQREAAWQPDDDTPSIEQLVRHIAWAKSSYCRSGFGAPMPIDDPAVNDDGEHADLPWEFPCGAAYARGLAPGIAGAIELLEKSHRCLLGCLESCAEDVLDQPIPTHHGKSAANFFTTMLMHDLYHAGTIRTRRTMYRVEHGESRG